MAANYGRPKPVDTVSYRSGYRLVIECVCGHRAEPFLGDLIKLGVKPDTTIWRVIDRLRCSHCGQPPKRAYVPHNGRGPSR